ncbi:hypothetical protein DAEQUDRAFT_135052 [Daedalea quercina L-15889]|uniref:Uncharacterized protein n=1 Tax=Daedalea quercina L-15889 TaxID=1314783 RepID=A0A165KNX6_9APHY|nr:hypothetical protein DAEQUDRAFT_135052 [Daedalea quercina L-15889]
MSYGTHSRSTPDEIYEEPNIECNGPDLDRLRRLLRLRPLCRTCPSFARRSTRRGMSRASVSTSRFSCGQISSHVLRRVEEGEIKFANTALAERISAKDYGSALRAYVRSLDHPGESVSSH